MIKKKMFKICNLGIQQGIVKKRMLLISGIFIFIIFQLFNTAIVANDLKAFAGIKIDDQLFTVVKKLEKYGGFKFGVGSDKISFNSKEDFSFSYKNIKKSVKNYEKLSWACVIDDLISSIPFKIDKYNDKYFAGGFSPGASGSIGVTLTTNNFINIKGVDFALEITLHPTLNAFAYNTYKKNTFNDFMFFDDKTIILSYLENSKEKKQKDLKLNKIFIPMLVHEIKLTSKSKFVSAEQFMGIYNIFRNKYKKGRNGRGFGDNLRESKAPLHKKTNINLVSDKSNLSIILEYIGVDSGMINILYNFRINKKYSDKLYKEYKNSLIKKQTSDGVKSESDI